MPLRYIDGFDFAETGGECSGDWPVADLPRLQDALRSNAGNLQFGLSGMHDSLGRPALKVRVAGVLELSCQRCLEALPYRVESESTLVLARREAELEAEAVDAEGPERILAGREMPVRDLIEDEVLLAVPIAPRHEECPVRPEADAEKGRSPFAGLRGLLGDH